MAEFKIVYYVLLVMSFLLVSVFLWGAVTYKKVKTNVKFLNRPMLALTLAIGAIAFIIAWIPIGMQIWVYDDELIRSDPGFIAILVLEFVSLVSFLVLAYVYAFDFGIAYDEKNNTLQFFGQAVNTEKIIALEEKKYSLKIVYEQGFKNIKKKITIFSPNAKAFVKTILTDVVAHNQSKSTETLATESISETTSVDVE